MALAIEEQLAGVSPGVADREGEIARAGLLRSVGVVEESVVSALHVGEQVRDEDGGEAEVGLHEEAQCRRSGISGAGPLLEELAARGLGDERVAAAQFERGVVRRAGHGAEAIGQHGQRHTNAVEDLARNVGAVASSVDGANEDGVRAGRKVREREEPRAVVGGDGQGAVIVQRDKDAGDAAIVGGGAGDSESARRDGGIGCRRGDGEGGWEHIPCADHDHLHAEEVGVARADDGRGADRQIGQGLVGSTGKKEERGTLRYEAGVRHGDDAVAARDGVEALEQVGAGDHAAEDGVATVAVVEILAVVAEVEEPGGGGGVRIRIGLGHGESAEDVAVSRADEEFIGDGGSRPDERHGGERIGAGRIGHGKQAALHGEIRKALVQDAVAVGAALRVGEEVGDGDGLVGVEQFHVDVAQHAVSIADAEAHDAVGLDGDNLGLSRDAQERREEKQENSFHSVD